MKRALHQQKRGAGFRWAATAAASTTLFGLLPGVPGWAQDGGDTTPPTTAPPPSGYRTGENGPNTIAPAETDAPAPPEAAASEDKTAPGPVRLARFSFLSGNVTWRPGDSADWSAATNNLPLREGAQIWVTGGGKAEIQFDDGSALRLGSGAVVTLQTLYSDANGEFTELRVNQGLVALRLLHEKSLYQIDAPNLSAKATGPAKLRLGIENDTEIAVRQGNVTVEGAQGKVRVGTGSYLDVTDSASAFAVTALPPADSWDQFNDDRDRIMDPARNGKYVPSNIALVSGDLGDYGTWRDDATYGSVWVPARVTSDWAPYRDGHWVWVDPFGWTWVSDEAWGWAPYHYGSWVHLSYGWGWCPGPRVQYWSPAVVHFSNYNGSVCWVPLAPRDVRYPSVLAGGCWGNGWSAYFSIGGAACYGPGDRGYFAARPWHNTVINHVTYVNNYYNRPVLGGHYEDHHLVPFNARFPGGVSHVGEGGFGHGGGHFAALGGRDGINAFEHGHSFVAGGNRPYAGPGNIRPDAHSYAASHNFVSASQGPRSVLSRPVFREPVRPEIARNNNHGGTFVTPSTRPTGAGTGRPTFGGGVTGGGRPSSGSGESSMGDRRPPTGFGGRDGGRQGIASRPGGIPSSPADAARDARNSVGFGSPRVSHSSAESLGGGRPFSSPGEGNRNPSGVGGGNYRNGNSQNNPSGGGNSPGGNNSPRTERRPFSPPTVDGSTTQRREPRPPSRNGDSNSSGSGRSGENERRSSGGGDRSSGGNRNNGSDGGGRGNNDHGTSDRSSGGDHGGGRSGGDRSSGGGDHGDGGSGKHR